MRFDAEQTSTGVGDPDRFAGWPEFLPPYTEFRTYPIVPTSEGHIAIPPHAERRHAGTAL